MAVAVPVTAGRTEDSHDIVMFAGHVIVGGVLSCTVINCVPEASLLQASLAVHDLTIVPVPLQPLSPKTLSEKAIMISVPGVQLSDAVAIPVCSTEVFSSHDIVIDGGTVSVGAVLSTIIMVWIHAAILPHISSACQCLVKDPVPLH